jgi:hypothetical protein
MHNLTIGLPVLFGIIVLSGCVGAGVQDAEEQARSGQARAMEGQTPGVSIWSLFGGNIEHVRTRLDAGLGKTKKEEMGTFGQPFRCKDLPTGGEVCGWYDEGMSLGSTDSTQHVVYFTFDAMGKASAWDYQGAYGKHSSRDSSLPLP